MDNKTFGNTSLLPVYDNFSNTFWTELPNLISPVVRFPVNVYILYLIVGRRLITSEFLTLNITLSEILICFYDLLGLPTVLMPNTDLTKVRRFLLGFVVTGRPGLLALVCVERYLAVVKPLVYLKFKPLKYKLASTGITWLGTLFSCFSRFYGSFSLYLNSVFVQVSMYSIVKLYCCIATLKALKQPGPGEGARQREGMDRIKSKAFRIIVIITVTVIIMYLPLLVVILLKDYFETSDLLNILNVCYISAAFSGYVHAFLFLQKFGQLPFMRPQHKN